MSFTPAFTTAIGLTVIVLFSVVEPQIFVAVKEYVKFPLFVKLTLPGFKTVEVAGDPFVKLHE